MNALARRFAWLALLLTGIAGPAYAQHAQVDDGALVDWMRGKLVFLEAAAETPQGIVVSTQGTGFFINRQGNILTSYHIIDKLGRINPSSLSMTARIASKNAPPIAAEIVDANNVRDVMVLDIENYAAPDPVCVNDHFVMLGRLKTPILTAGFPRYLPFYAVGGDFVGEGPNGTWAVDLIINEGQSGSPVFDQNGFVIGIAKGQMENNLEEPVPGVYIVVPVPRNGNTSTAYDITDPNDCPYATEVASTGLAAQPPGGDIDAQVDACAASMVEKEPAVPFVASGGARAPGTGFSGGEKRETSNVCYAIAPDMKLTGQVKVSDLGNNGGRGSVGPVQYLDPDGDGHVDTVCIEVQAWSDSGPFAAGGWQNAQIEGMVTRIFAAEDLNAFKDQCRKTILAEGHP